MKKYIDFLTIPIGLILLLIVNLIGNAFGLHMFGVEPLQKIFLALVFVLVILGFSMLIMKIKFPWLFEFINNDFEQNNEWNALNPKEKTLVGLGLFALIFFCFSMLVANM